MNRCVKSDVQFSTYDKHTAALINFAPSIIYTKDIINSNQSAVYTVYNLKSFMTIYRMKACTISVYTAECWVTYNPVLKLLYCRLKSIQELNYFGVIHKNSCILLSAVITEAHPSFMVIRAPLSHY